LGIGVDYEGECEITCTCPDISAPVCSDDDVAYQNECDALCDGATIRYEGECDGRECASNDECAEDLVCRPDIWTCEPVCELDCTRAEPVCGADGVTYFCGEHDAFCHGTTVAYPRECDEACDCPDIEVLVCGADRITYASACFARCAGMSVDSEGECFDDCACPGGYDPVCGLDGVTYGSECIARCARADVGYSGECVEACTCVEVSIDAVCGDDGRVYPNACEARCSEVEIIPCDLECDGNEDCDEGLICYPPTSECIVPCAVDCDESDPVCGRDAETYSCGVADAHCMGTTVSYPGECADCGCPETYAPVCGNNGLTYANLCIARCLEIGIQYEGECLDDGRD
jgi:coxsackievirus/adenovirus receptor